MEQAYKAGGSGDALHSDQVDGAGAIELWTSDGLTCHLSAR